MNATVEPANKRCTHLDAIEDHLDAEPPNRGEPQFIVRLALDSGQPVKPLETRKVENDHDCSSLVRISMFWVRIATNSFVRAMLLYDIVLDDPIKARRSTSRSAVT
jgi:hypothetical protein